MLFAIVLHLQPKTIPIPGIQGISANRGVQTHKFPRQNPKVAPSLTRRRKSQFGHLISPRIPPGAIRKLMS